MYTPSFANRSLSLLLAMSLMTMTVPLSWAQSGTAGSSGAGGAFSSGTGGGSGGGGLGTGVSGSTQMNTQSQTQSWGSGQVQQRPVSLPNQSPGGAGVSQQGLMTQPDTQMMHQRTNMSVQQQRTYVIPAGTGLPVRSAGAMPQALGDEFTAVLTEPVVVEGQAVLPAGSQVRGTVVGVNATNQTADVQFRDVSTTTGEVIPIRSRATVSQLYGGVRTQQANAGAPATIQGQTQTERYPRTLFPTVTWGGQRQATPAGRVLAGTAGGAAFGGATGALSGLISSAVYRDDIGFSEGTGALRGAAWGAAVGAGLGLVTGLVSAAADRDQTAVSTVGTRVRPNDPVTNISTGSLEEIPVAYTPGQTTGAGVGTAGQSEFLIILDQPVSITR